jgi:hypothetical protein
MREYSPKRRTALVLTGTGTSGAYHAGVLRAIDESGVKIDVVVGSGVGTVAAAFAAAAGGPRLYGKGGFWDGAGWDALYRLRAGLRTAILLLACSFGVFLLPVALALVGGVLFLPLALADVAMPGLTARMTAAISAVPGALRAPYLVALALPIFVLCALAFLALLRMALRDRRRIPESFEAILDPTVGEVRLGKGLWELARGSAISSFPTSEEEIGRKYVGLVAENLGQPGFRELILRTADLDTGGVVPFVLLDDTHRAAFAAARSRGPRSRGDGIPGAVDLRNPGYDALLFDAAVTGLLPPGAAPVRRVAFPRGGIFAGEMHRLTDAALAGGCGISEAVAAGADQVVVVTAAPQVATAAPRRRGPRALADGLLSTLERRAVDGGIRSAERINRMVETLGHRTEDGGHGWQDPVSGRVYRDISLYVVRPDRRVLGTLEWDGGEDPATEALETPDDLAEQGYRDAYRLFVEPVVGAFAEPQRAPIDERQTVEL